MICEGDQIETRNFYTVGQLAEFMDVEVDADHEIVVNNRTATMDTLIYENFTIDWTVLSFGAAAIPPEQLPVAVEWNRPQGLAEPVSGKPENEIEGDAVDLEADAAEEIETAQLPEVAESAVDGVSDAASADSGIAQDVETKEPQMSEDTKEDKTEGSAQVEPQLESGAVTVYVNGQPVRLTGKNSYIFVDIFDFYDFDLSASAGRAIITEKIRRSQLYWRPEMRFSWAGKKSRIVVKPRGRERWQREKQSERDLARTVPKRKEREQKDGIMQHCEWEQRKLYLCRLRYMPHFNRCRHQWQKNRGRAELV